MQAGLFVDNSQGQYVQSVWVEGHPSEQRVFGLSLGTLSLQGRTRYPVTVYRCPECGFLQAFALPIDKERQEEAQTLLRSSIADSEIPAEELLRPTEKE